MGKNKYTAPASDDDALEAISKGWPKALQCHPLHRQHPLVKSLRPAYSCDSCHTGGSSWSFLCAACDFDLHPDCALEAHLADAAKSWPRAVPHALHRAHPLVRTRLDAFWCDSCGERGAWWCFYCEPCDFGLHLHCAVGPRRHDPAAKPRGEMEKGVKESYWCSRCAEEGKGLCYSWEDCDVDLHPRCACEGGGGGGSSWPKSKKHELHPEHELVRSRNVGYYCNRCWTEGKGWSFGCDDCDFHLHPRCAVEVAATVEMGWVDGVMHEQLRQQVLQQVQGGGLRGGSEVVGNEEGEEEEEEVTRVEAVAAAEKLRVEATMSQLEQLRLYAEAVAMIRTGSAQAVSDLAGGLPPQRRRDPPPYNWNDQSRPFGYR